MKNYIQEGDVLDLVAPSGGVVTGGGYKIGMIFVIAMVTAAQGETFQGRVKGVVELTKATADEVAAGDLLYWDNGAGKVTKTAGANMLVGAAVEAAPATTDTNVKLRLCGPGGAGKAAVVAALAQDISGTYVEAEVQAISTKVDAILTALKAAGLMASA